jgi:hypothetical protein
MSIPYQPKQGQPRRYTQPDQFPYEQPGQGQPGQYKGPDDQQPYRCQSYTVRQGDTLNTLASQYGVSVSSLASANPDMAYGVVSEYVFRLAEEDSNSLKAFFIKDTLKNKCLLFSKIHLRENKQQSGIITL